MLIRLGDIGLMEKGQPLAFDKDAASKYLKDVTDVHGTVYIEVRCLISHINRDAALSRQLF